jgi:5-methyltetrahydropteroyltriglutamate--homocysteine methyltransferase
VSDFLDFAERVVSTINEALINVPRHRVRLHVCWGNYEVLPHFACYVWGDQGA